MSNNKKTGSIPGTSRKRNSTKPARPYGAIGNCKYAREDTTRDEMDALFGDAGWEDLTRIYMECKALTIIPSQVAPLLTNAEYLRKIPDIKELLLQVEVLAKDTKHFNEELELIRGQHVNKSGSSEDPNDLVECLGIGESYQQWLIAYQTIVVPNVNSILTMFNEGQQLLLEEQAETEQTLIKDVTDSLNADENEETQIVEESPEVETV